MREDITTPPRSSDLPFQVKMTGISYCDGTYEINRRSSPLTCMEYVVKGKGTVTEDGRTFEAKAGDIYLLHEGRDHYYHSDDEEPWEKIWMNLTGTAVEHLLSAYGLNLVNHVSGVDLETDFKNFYKIAGECTSATEVSDRCSVLFHEILQKIAHHLREENQIEATAGRIKEMIDSSAGFDLNLEEIAGQLFFTKTHIIRVFRKAYGVTPYEYILSGKLRLAKDLLANTSLTVTEISARLNFCDPHYFTNFFRSRTGITPREYRKQKAENKSI